MDKITESPSRAAIDPRLWLKKHQAAPVSGDIPPFVSMGMQAIATSAGSVRAALAKAPDLRAEIVIAYLLGDTGISKSARNRIMKLVEREFAL
ncbi:MAG: hypothetical protein B7X93_11480 [Hydrogenophilales bacterium 17-61-9]|nr:MAG: hypothetical protein B7X93_11480 [Hydrogenophilales bacterium 17-61-9]